ncbi:Homeodomain-like superfamily protein [Raphanus sativus]|nr:Homeodomain-like superfamily protein [Raphanus sativus]
MVDSSSSNKKRKEYDTTTILKLLQEMAYYAELKMDWNELVKKTSTGITSAREYQLLWRHLAYRDSLLPMDDDSAAPLLQDDDSDMEFELEASPPVSVDAVSEAVAHVKVIAASYVPIDSDIPEDSICEAPLTINIPYGLQRRPQEPSDSYWSSRGMNITFPISLQKAAEGHNGNALASNMGPRKKRKKWSAEEDQELIAAVNRHGEGSWALISKEEYEGEITVSQLSQRWGSIRRRLDISNSSTQSYQQRTEAANRALSLAVGNRVPSKKVAVGIPPVLTSGSITGAQGNGANSGSSLQGQQQAKPVVQAIPRAETSVQTAKARVAARKPTSTLRAELMVTANSVATAACMSGLGTAASVPKVEPGKNAAPALVPKVKSSQASLPRPSGISSVMNAEPVKTASAASLPRPSGMSSTLNAEPVKSAAAASFPRPLGTTSASKAEPVKTTSTAVLPRPSGVISAPKADLVKTGHAVSLPRPSGIISSPKTAPVKTASAASSPRPASMLSAPVRSVSPAATAANTKTQVAGSSSSFNKLSHMAPFSKGPTVQNISVPASFASSRLAPTQRANTATVMPQNPSVGVAVTSSSKPVGVQKEQTQASRTSPLVTTTLQPNKTISTNSVISTGKPVATQVDTPPSLMSKKDQVLQTCTEKSSLAKPPEKQSSSTVSPSVVAEPETKPKDEASKGKSPDVATVPGTEHKGL